MLRIDAGIAVALLLASRATGIAPFIRDGLDPLRAPASLGGVPAEGAASKFPLLHSHNDYEQPHPLEDALSKNFTSVEADLWIEPSGAISVSHMGWASKGTLKDLYLDPLQKRVSERGSVYGDGKEFFLWLELKTDAPELTQALEKELTRFPMLTTFDGANVRKGAVTVILTGSLAGKRRYVEAPGVRRATRDAEVLLAEDPPSSPLWSWYSLKWSDFFHWTGIGRMPEEEKARFRTLLELAHSKGRRVRVYGAPESESYWREATDAGLDMISADSIARLGRFRVMREIASGRAQIDKGRSPEQVRNP